MGRLTSRRQGLDVADGWWCVAGWLPCGTELAVVVNFEGDLTHFNSGRGFPNETNV